MTQLMPPPLAVSCFSKIQIRFIFLVPAHPGSPGQRAVKRLCVCVCDRSKKCLTIVKAKQNQNKQGYTTSYVMYAAGNG